MKAKKNTQGNNWFSYEWGAICSNLIQFQLPTHTLPQDIHLVLVYLQWRNKKYF